MRSALLSALLGALALAVTGCPTGGAARSKKIRIQGSTTVNPIMTEIAERLREKRNLRITVDTQGGSAGGISSAGEGLSDIGMSSKPLVDKDKKRFSDRDLRSHVIGYDAVALVVSTPVYEGGVKSLTREQIAGIFTGRFTSWRELGGPDLDIFIYNKEPGRGTLAIFEQFAFGGARPETRPLKNYAEVGGNEETRQKIESHGAAIGQLSAAWAEKREGLRIIAIKTEKGEVLPTAQAMRDHSYPMFRTLLLITAGEPTEPVRDILDFTLSAEGQDIVRKVGYLPVANGA